MTDMILRIVSAVSALLAAAFAYFAWDTAQEHLVADTRAWVYPVSARVDLHNGGVQSGHPTPITISIRNSGREPAIDFVAQQRISSFSNPKDQSFYSTFKPAL